MGKFSFQAKQLDGRTVAGEVEANNEMEARVKIRAKQMIPVKVTPFGQATVVQPGFSVSGFLVPRVKSKDLQVFTRQFSTLINSGIAVVQSLELLERTASNLALKTALNRARADISQGKKLADALMGHEKVFDRLYVNLVRAGEEAGVLDTILNRLAVYIEKSVKIKNKVIGAMYYPIGIVIVACIVVYAILRFVIPKFEEIFKSSGMELPVPTQIVINLSHFVQDYWYVPIIVIVASTYTIRAYYKTPTGRYNLDLFLLKVPIFGSLLQKSAIARFTGTLSTLLGCGVSILEALEIAANVSGNAVIERTLMRSRQVISEGRSIVEPLSQDKFIPQMVVQMIGVGEQTGALDQMLAKIADFYEEEVDTAVSALTSIIEPIMMVILGGLIGGLVIAMYLPIFNLAGTAK